MSDFPENSRDRPFSFGASFNTAAQWTSRLRTSIQPSPSHGS